MEVGWAPSLSKCMVAGKPHQVWQWLRCVRREARHGCQGNQGLEHGGLAAGLRQALNRRPKPKLSPVTEEEL